MRLPILFVMLLGACEGEPVASVDPTTDAATDAATCTGANLVPNGSFDAGTAGWLPYNCIPELDPAGGPCGNAVRLRSLKLYGTIARRINRPFASGTRFRLRAWFRADVPVAEVPSVSVGFHHPGDGGEVSTQSFSARLPALDTKWTLAETTYTLAEAEAGFTVSVNSNRPHDGTPDLLVAGITLTTE